MEFNEPLTSIECGINGDFIRHGSCTESVSDLKTVEIRLAVVRGQSIDGAKCLAGQLKRRTYIRADARLDPR